MNKILKLGLGLIAGAAVAHVAYHGYKDLEEALDAEMLSEIRRRFSQGEIQALWLYDEPDETGDFRAGLVLDGQTKYLSINPKSLVITEKGEQL
ncbi:hypothetical protein [Lactococcus termiticola]|uniref:Uncharacterized protein n=1 Tax=Lactococcus termiticola TaxID=2169526 RepID=A0A2R5HD88_9LACT|nr:hypothetical protein [Lactococcus termiticola]GBG96039.1 hypothetical protein NtB2_00142 [Lactococcus termiticola]